MLTNQCGLEHEEALYALGRRSGGFPDYQGLSRQAQLAKIQELTGSGLSLKEAERVVGVRISDDGRVDNPAPQSSVAEGRGQTPPSKKECFHCRRSDIRLVEVRPGVWLCDKHQKVLRKAKKLQKEQRDRARYYNAVFQPENRGLKGIRK